MWKGKRGRIQSGKRGSDHDKNENKNKHLTQDDHIEIQECLAKGMTFKAIAVHIVKDPTTVSKEVKAHDHTYTNGFIKTADSLALSENAVVFLAPFG